MTDFEENRLSTKILIPNKGHDIFCRRKQLSTTICAIIGDMTDFEENIISTKF